MPDPVPMLLCAGAYIAAAILTIKHRKSVRIMRRVAWGLLVGVPFITLLKMLPGTDFSQGGVGELMFVTCLFVGPSVLPSLPLLGVPLVAKWLNDRTPTMWGMFGAVVSGGAWMTALMSIDLRADALNSVSFLFGPIVGMFIATVCGLLVTTVWWVVSVCRGP
ncbi:MAG: hypothetical protein ACKVZJ_08510 [Phycisphaerales bacterium]